MLTGALLQWGVTSWDIMGTPHRYMPGAFDLFNNGHIAAMAAAKENGEYLICGIHTDNDIEIYTGQP